MTGLNVPEPLKIDPQATFDALVAWTQNKATEQRAPGFVVGLSGTDSILTFLVCAKALENLGRPQNLVGLNFEHETKNEDDGHNGVVCLKQTYNWVAHEIFPYLQQMAPQASLEINNLIPHSDENLRNGYIQSRAVRDLNPRAGLSGTYLLWAGSRNATEDALGLFTQSSKAAAILPLKTIPKSAVLQLCAYFNVPQIAIDKSREVDCDCGRFEVQANHLMELDLYIAFRQGRVTKDVLEALVPKDVLIAVRSFYAEEVETNRYHHATPYAPDADLTVRVA